MTNVDSRLAALASALERRRLEQTEPIDPLSASLYAFEEEMANLDHLGKVVLLEELNGDGLGLDMADLERMIREATA